MHEHFIYMDQESRIKESRIKESRIKESRIKEVHGRKRGEIQQQQQDPHSHEGWLGDDFPPAAALLEKLTDDAIA